MLSKGMYTVKIILTFVISSVFTIWAFAAEIVPHEVELPGTQPNEVSNFESPNKCDNCHAGYNNAETQATGTGHPQDEPATGWRGAAMGNAGRDPIFWATMAVAEQDFDGAGDLCVRCHSTAGWYGGRSTPTDGSGLAASDSDGVDCDTCHSMTNPDDSEHAGVMNSPFIANCSSDNNVPDKNCETSDEGFYGSGMTSLWNGSDKLGPYSENDADARHQFMQSKFHRDVDFCGSCHDVSNSVVGDLAPSNGAQHGAPAVISSGGNLGGPVEEKAAFNNPPYAYGIVERTFSEYKASAFPTTRVSDFSSLPVDLQKQNGSIEVTYQAALAAGKGGDYADGTTRFFSCQSCHMRPTISAGANKRGIPVRSDLPQHDHTGGNYWLSDIIQYQDSKSMLRLGGDLNTTQITALGYGQQRAVKHLQQAASLNVNGDTLKVINLTGHKLISGYPEGRRMWLNIKWYDANGTMTREDGAYGPLVDDQNNPVMVVDPADASGLTSVQVESILDLDSPNLRLYEAHYAMTKEWADVLVSLVDDQGQRVYPDDFPLSYDRFTGAIDYTLRQLSEQNAGGYHETFHFVLNDYVAKDNRIPPYGMQYDIAKKRNALPVPYNQYGGGVPGSIYNYWDEIDLLAIKPSDAVSAQITLYYQGTSWDYIQFLNNANNGQNAFLGQEGKNMLEAWINAEVPVAIEVAGNKKMVPPVVMATANWNTPPTANSQPECRIDTPVADVTINEGDSINYTGTATDSDGTIVSYSWVFSGGNPASSSLEDPGNVTYASAGTYIVTFTASDNEGENCQSVSRQITVNQSASQDTMIIDDTQTETGYYTGKGNNVTFVASSVFSQGDTIVIRFRVQDTNGNPLSGVIVTTSISGPEENILNSEPSDVNGIAEIIWKTSTANRKGNGGTATGSYSALVTELTLSGYIWGNPNIITTEFTIQ